MVVILKDVEVLRLVELFKIGFNFCFWICAIITETCHCENMINSTSVALHFFVISLFIYTSKCQYIEDMWQKLYNRFKHVYVLTRFFVLSEHIITLMSTSVYMNVYCIGISLCIEHHNEDTDISVYNSSQYIHLNTSLLRHCTLYHWGKMIFKLYSK